MTLRNSQPEHDPRDRFALYRLCDCPTCGGKGKGVDVIAGVPAKCPECRGEGRIRQEIAACETPEAVGVALVTLAREGEWEECPFGLLDREGETGRKWLILPWLPSARNVRDAARTSDMFTSKQIKRLNQARSVLKEIEHECSEARFNRDENTPAFPDGFDYGKLAECCDAAEGAIFNVLNIANSHLDAKLSDEQLFNRKAEEVEV
jgi:hypothetical protein